VVQPLPWPVWGWPNHPHGPQGLFGHPQTGRPNPLNLFIYFYFFGPLVLGDGSATPKAKHPNFYFFYFFLWP
jgi:hypothetical protein